MKKRGGAIYAADPSTDILIWCFVDGDGFMNRLIEFEVYYPGANPTADLLYEMALDENCIFVAHNAYFERHIWTEIMVKRYGFPEIPRHRWKCTLAKCQAYGLPAKLEMAARALNLSVQKDMKGHQIMLLLCKPQRDGTFITRGDRPDLYEILYDYCEVDVIAERQIDKYVPDLSRSEKKVWEIDQRINDEGIYIDLNIVRKAIALGTQHKTILKKRFGTVTGGDFSPTQRAKFKAWLFEQGVDVPNTKKTTLEKIQSEEWYINEAILILKEANKSSLAKYPAMLARSNDEGLARELQAYHAAHTGRSGGRGIQLKNMAHTKFEMEAACECIDACDYDFFASLYGDVPAVLSSAGRGMVIPDPGCEFLVGDYSGVEAVGIAWLAGQADSIAKFWAKRDPYVEAAAEIFQCTIEQVTKAMRSVGKVAVLALGYGGGIAALIKMSISYRVDLTIVIEPLMATASPAEWAACHKSYILYLKRKEEREERLSEEPAPMMLCYVADLIKQRWRAKNANIVQFWADQEAAAIRAVHSPRDVIAAGKIEWFMYRNFLHCRLPSGRDIHYPFPRVHTTSRSEKLVYAGVNTMTHKWEWSMGTYGGKISENQTQGFCRDVMVVAMKKMEDTIYRTRLEVYDELVASVPIGQGDLEEFLGIMREPIDWAPGMPIACEGWRGPRYKKAG